MWQRKRALSAREEDLGKPERSGDKSASRIALAYGDGSQLNRRAAAALGCVSICAERLNGGREALTVQPPQLVAALRRN